MTLSAPPNIRLIVLAGALLSACGAAWLGMDLYSGLENGIFHLVRTRPVSAADGFRYWLLVVGESLAVLTLSGVTVAFVILLMGRRLRR